MKYLIFVAFVLISCTKQITRVASTSCHTDSLPIPPVFPLNPLKNVQVVPFDAKTTGYDGMGDAFSVGNKMCYIYRHGISETANGYLSYAHLYRGATYEAFYNPATDIWSSPQAIDTAESGRSLSDVHGAAQMDNGQYIYFSSISPTAIASLDHPNIPLAPGNFIPFFRIAADSNLNWGDRVLLSGYDATIRSGTAFGELQHGEAPGEYYVGFCQFGYGTEYARKIYCLKTTDYFHTYSFIQIYSGTTTFDEPAIAYLGAGKLFCFLRIDNGGFLYIYKSSDYGNTWTAVAQSYQNNIGWSYYYAKIPSAVFMYNGLLNIMYHDRDSRFVEISKGNDPNVFFSQKIPVFNPSEIYWYDDNGTGKNNYSLGYPSCALWKNGYFLFVASKETNQQDADLYYTMDDLHTDVAPPLPPSVKGAYITSNSLQVQIDLADKDLQNVRYFSLDMSTDSTFSTFITASYNNLGAQDHINVPFSNVRVISKWINVKSLTTGTTYWVRVKSVNNIGSSIYTTTKITTL